VNPTAAVVQSVVAYPTVEVVPGPVDLAVIAVPSSLVLEVAEQCGRKGVRSLVVLTAGFGEVDGTGRDLEKSLLQLCRATGMRLIGPNCIGVLNTAAGLNATFGPSMPPAGRVAFASQSGALGLAAIQEAKRRGIGISDFVSMGNKTDISGNDLLQYWESDPETDVILLYLESFGNPRKFGRIARRVAQSKPIVAIKSGRSTAGARASASHTGALVAASDVTVDALFRQAGVIRADTIDGLFDIAALVAKQPVPTGGRVAIVTNVGGPAILCADTCEAEGLTVPPLSPETRAALKALLPAEASAVNPVDMLADARRIGRNVLQNRETLVPDTQECCFRGAFGHKAAAPGRKDIMCGAAMSINAGVRSRLPAPACFAISTAFRAASDIVEAARAGRRRG